MLVNRSHGGTTLVNGMAPCSLRNEERNTRASDDLIMLLAISRCCQTKTDKWEQDCAPGGAAAETFY
jgi:hypothetical protein